MCLWWACPGCVRFQGSAASPSQAGSNPSSAIGSRMNLGKPPLLSSRAGDSGRSTGEVASSWQLGKRNLLLIVTLRDEAATSWSHENGQAFLSPGLYFHICEMGSLDGLAQVPFQSVRLENCQN